ncbi:MAG TPA: hypothetical protein VG345_02180, partial [Bryobacteraceae bacterium]|nr:hypothetical protein [Bryobacteraceae bacterium]
MSSSENRNPAVPSKYLTEDPPHSDEETGAAAVPSGESDERVLEFARVGLVAVVLVLVGIHVVPSFHGLNLLGLAGLLAGGYPIFREALTDIFRGRMTMELSMTIALVAASIIGEIFTALLIALFVLVAEILEGFTVGRGRRAIRKLVDLLPHSAEIRAPGGTIRREL